MISSTDNKKDMFIMDLQNHLGKGIAALGTVLSKILESTETNTENPDTNLSGLVEAGKLLCTVHHAMTNHRKFQLYPNFNPKILKIAAAEPRDSMLFGEGFSEKCKSAKNVELVAKELKASSSSKPKNFKGYAPKSRWKQQERKGKRNNYSGNKTPAYNKTPHRSIRSRADQKPGQKQRRQEWATYRPNN